MLNSGSATTIKVFSLVAPYCMEFRQQQFQTVLSKAIQMGEFRKMLKEWFRIEVEDQILIKNGQQITRASATPFKLLQITPETTFLLVAKQKSKPEPKRNQQKEREVKEMLETLNGSIERARMRERHRQHILQVKEKLIYTLEGRTVDTIITAFIKSLHIPNSELLLINQPKLRFILGKISADNQQLQQILLSRMKTVKLGLIDLSLLQKKKKMPCSTLIKQQFDALCKLGYPSKSAMKALEISKNDLQTALSLLYYRKIDDYSQDSESGKKMNPVKQYISIFEWLSKEQPATITLLNNSPQFMEVYLNSLKHIQPTIFKLILRWKSFITKMVQHLYGSIKLKAKKE